MEELLISISRSCIRVIDAMALVIVVVGTLQAFVTGLWDLLTGHHAGLERRYVWLRYARWLIAGLTFQLAADIIETSITPSWDDVARLGVIAVIRTFLNYFLERDVTEVRERQEKTVERTA
jgi:uncharacterized membrane protein